MIMDRTNKRWMACLVATVIGISVLSACGSINRDSSGEVIEEGSVSAFEMQLGDCLTDTFQDSSTSFSEANAVPCEQSHAFEVYYTQELDGDTYPSDVSSQADIICELSLAGIINGIIDESPYVFVSTYPSQNSWENGSDREVVCLVGMYDGTNTTGRIVN